MNQTDCFHRIADQIWCVDANYVRPGNACLYLIGDQDEYAIIETGAASSEANLLHTLQTLGIDHAQIRYVIPTHIHLDHAGAVGLYMQRFPDASLLVHPKGARHMIDPTRLVASSKTVYGDQRFHELYGDIIPVAAQRVRELADGDAIQIGSRTLTVMHTRGHADHHYCLWDERTRGWFSGDMFGVCYGPLRLASGNFVLPTTTPVQFDPDAYIDSVARLCAKQPARMYLTHFGALEFHQDQADLLCAQIQTYAELGIQIGPDVNALNEAIMSDLMQRISARENASVARSLIDEISADASLNADGVAVWRKRALGM